MLRLTIVGVGRLKAGLERELAARYVDRAALAGRSVGLSIEALEVDESRARRAADRKRAEAEELVFACRGTAEVVALDEVGKALDSPGFADLIGRARDTGRGGLMLVIGGADGLDPEFRRRADHVVCFGAMTWPHQLVRVMAAEQVYRSVTILSGHPYHKL